MIIDPYKKKSIEQFIFGSKKERKLKFVFAAEKNYECYVISKKDWRFWYKNSNKETWMTRSRVPMN